MGHCAWQNQFSLWTIPLLSGGGRYFPLGKRATCTGFLPGPSNGADGGYSLQLFNVSLGEMTSSYGCLHQGGLFAL